MPLALAAGRNAVRAVTSFLVKLRDVYQVTQMHNKHFAIQKYDVHECILTFLNMHDMAIC